MFYSEVTTRIQTLNKFGLMFVALTAIAFKARNQYYKIFFIIIYTVGSKLERLSLEFRNDYL
jgi:hypothetical protein